MDISAKFNYLRFKRDTTPAVASVPSAPLKKLESAVETIKEAKRTEFPVKPDSQKKKSNK